MDIHEILLKYWNYASFRPVQEQIIQSVLEGNDTLALMPTGGGKSLCYQVPTLSGPGLCIVVSPLIALMKDQVEQLNSKGIEAVAIFAGMRKREIDIALDACVYNNNLKFLYLSPERLQTDIVRERVRYMNVRLIAIDEAHCISQWGYDFRPSYLQIAVLRELHPEVPLLAVTATATPEVLSDVKEKLKFREAKSRTFRSAYKRENLAFMVIEETDKSSRALNIVRKVGGSGIIYVRNRRETRELAQFLMQHGIKADFYHAGLDTALRHRKQAAWMREEVPIMVATHAFGMGIDKSNVQFVLHMDIPDAPEAYYQEAGRAGRDGEKAYAVLLFQEADIQELQHKFELSFPGFEAIAQIYYNIGNYVQLAYGAGHMLTFEFDLRDFCKRFQLHPIQTLQAIKFLENDGWLSLSEHVYLPARFRFEVSQSEVYRFQVEQEKWDGLIKALLRAYGGAFEQFTPLQEADLARRMGWTFGAVQQGLEFLQQQGLLRYIPRSDHPQLTFLRPRSDTAHLSIDTEFIQARKALARTQLDAMLAYINSAQCRAQSLLEYFGIEEEPCGICDRCIRRRKKQNQRKADRDIETYIMDQLKGGPRSLDALLEKLDEQERDACFQGLTTMLDKGKIKLNMNQYYIA